MQEQPIAQPPQDPTLSPTQVGPTSTKEVINPGKGIGIAGFILALVPLTQIVGLVLSIVGIVKSKKAGHKNPLALAGVIISSCLLLLTIPLMIFAAISVTGYNGIQARAKTSSAVAFASNIQKKAELFMDENNRYPSTLQEVKSMDNDAFFVSTDLYIEPTHPGTLAFYTCGIDGNKISYWNYTNKMPVSVYTGYASAASRCTLVE